MWIKTRLLGLQRLSVQNNKQILQISMKLIENIASA